MIEPLNIINVHTDGFDVYISTPKQYNHTTTKAETWRVEGTNCMFRHYVPRLKRRTLNYSKKYKPLEKMVYLFCFLWNNKIKKVNQLKDLIFGKRNPKFYEQKVAFSKL